MKTLTWLASYPRSGNTWLRLFLANWIANGDEPVKINDLPLYGLGFQDVEPRLWKFVTGEGVPAEDVQIARRAEVLRAIPNWLAQEKAQGTGAHYLVKTHCYRGTINGQSTIPEDATFRSVYIIRDPRKVAVSYSTFSNVPLEDTVNMMNNEQTKIGVDRPYQYLSSWSRHVWSWQRDSLVVRYEDLPGAFIQIAHYLGLGLDPRRLERALHFSALDEAMRQEDRGGFKESLHGRFFGATHRAISSALIERIEKEHGLVMRAYGYLR